MPRLTTGTLSPARLSRRKAQLRVRLKELDSRLRDIDGELLSHQAKDFEEMATEREQDEALNALGAEGEREIRMINAALGRIEEGEYGFCTKCGARIPEARLDLLPATPFCPICAR